MDKQFFTGTVVFFLRNEGYGFIKADCPEMEKEIFFHFSHIICNSVYRKLEKKDRVRFALGVNREGRPMAIDIEKINDLGAHQKTPESQR